MKSSLKNMVLVLFSISLIASLCLGLVNMVTKDPIAAAKLAAEQEAIKKVLPEFDAIEKSQIDSLKVVVNKATKGGEVVGYAIKSEATGFSDVVKLMVGFDTNGTILCVDVLEQKETPGLGTKMTIEGDSIKNPLLKLNGKSAPNIDFRVKKDGGDVDALTAATISSRAYVKAVETAYKVFQMAAGWTDKVEANTGASKTNGVEEPKQGNFEPKRAKEE
jgi:electron transport complex protein RnfG